VISKPSYLIDYTEETPCINNRKMGEFDLVGILDIDIDSIPSNLIGNQPDLKKKKSGSRMQLKSD
jgi:hypothetical protein